MDVATGPTSWSKEYVVNRSVEDAQTHPIAMRCLLIFELLISYGDRHYSLNKTKSVVAATIMMMITRLRAYYPKDRRQRTRPIVYSTGKHSNLLGYEGSRSRFSRRRIALTSHRRRGRNTHPAYYCVFFSRKSTPQGGNSEYIIVSHLSNPRTPHPKKQSNEDRQIYHAPTTARYVKTVEGRERCCSR